MTPKPHKQATEPTRSIPIETPSGIIMPEDKRYVAIEREVAKERVASELGLLRHGGMGATWDSTRLAGQDM